MKRLILFLFIIWTTGAWAAGVPYPGSVEWEDIDNVPSGFADGTDDTGAITDLDDLPGDTDDDNLIDGDLIEVATSTDAGGAIFSNSFFRVALNGLVTIISGVFQPADPDLDTYAGITPSPDVQSLLASADYAAIVSSMGAGDVTGVLDDSIGAVPVLLQDATAFTINDETPSVSGHSVFITANAATPTTISDFDDASNGQIILVIVNDASTTFDFTSSGLEGMDADYAASNGNMLLFVYASQDSQWHCSSIFPTPDQFLDNCSLSPTGGTWNLSAVTLTMPASYTPTATANPHSTWYDSDAPGSELADKEVANISVEYVDGNEDAENADVLFQAMQDGSEVTYMQFDESDDSVEILKALGILSTSAPTLDLNGELAYDTEVAGLSGGCISYYHTGGIRYILDLDTAPSDDDYVVAYDADADKFYMKVDAGSGAAGTVTTLKEATSQVGGADIVSIDFGAGFDLAEDPDTEINITLDLTEISGATDSAQGPVEIATTAETNTGTDATRAVTPDGLAGSVYAEENVCWTIVDTDTDVATGDGVQAYVVPASLNGFNIVDVCASVYTTGGTSGTTDVQLRRRRSGADVDVLSTKVTITYNEYTAADEVVNTDNDDLSTGDLILVDVDAIAGTAPKGLSVVFTARKP